MSKGLSIKGILWLVGLFITVMVVIVGLFTFVERVPEGKVAVVYSPAGGAKEVLNPGWHLIKPLEKTQEYPTRITIVETAISVTTNDGKKITMPARYEMKVDKSKVLEIFQELGSQDIEQIQEGYLYQKLFKASRSVVSTYSVLDIFGTKTTEASAKVAESMADSSEGLGFIIADVTLGNPEVDKDTQAAIDARVQKAQELERLNLEKDIATANAAKQKIESTGVADAEIERARGEAESAKIRAQGEAEANRTLNASLTENVLKLEEIKARQKHGWITISGTTPLVEVKEKEEAK
ncbi:MULTISPECIES: prohibitin family protein [unclassified Psychrobacillus]|uniref:prohibitin family protein n=1 Tax=unclassified Psychrobacillus TaxID=2636677 RepID=UPI0030F6C617